MEENSLKNLFKPDDESSWMLLKWQEELSPGEKAELRRAHSPEDVIFCEAFHKLKRKLFLNSEKLAAIVGLSAHIKKHDGSKLLAEQMASPKSGDKAVVSDLRFRRILAIDESDELYSALIRIIRMLDGNANLLDLAKSVYWWNAQTKKEWAYKYWEKSPQENKTGGKKQ